MKKLLILFIPFILTGCYDYKELNELAIVSAIALDKEDNIYHAYMEVINIKKDEDVNPKFYIFESTGKSINEAINNTINSSSINNYLNHIDILLIDEDIAKNGIENILDYFYRNSNIRVEFIPIICKDKKCKDIISTQTPLKELNSKNIKLLIENDSEFLGNTNNVTFTDMLDNYLNPYDDIAIPAISIKEINNDVENPNVNYPIKSKGIAYFKGTKLNGFLNTKESIFYNFINGNINNISFTIPCSNYFNINVINAKNDRKYKNNTIYLDISINASLSECNCDVELNKKDSLDKLNKLTEEYIKNNIDNMIKDFKKKNIDIFNFKDFVYKESKAKVKDLNKINYKTSVKVNIMDTENGIKEAKNEE